MVADLYKLVPNLSKKSHDVTIPLHEKAINTNDIMDIFIQKTLPPTCHEPRIFHIDISHEVGLSAIKKKKTKCRNILYKALV